MWYTNAIGELHKLVGKHVGSCVGLGLLGKGEDSNKGDILSNGALVE
jgi:hypothetical protein